MTLQLVAAISISGMVFGRLLFKKWINHLTMYCIIMGGLTFLYELKLLPYVDITPLAWFYISSSFLSFSLGILTIITARSLSFKNQIFTRKENINLPIFKDGGITIKYTLFFLSTLCLFAAIQNWVVLIKMFGSITAVIINAITVYRMTGRGEIKGIIPYLSYSGYVAIFFSGIYTAYKRRFSLITFYPFIGIIIKELASVGRAGMLFALIEFLLSFLLFRHLLNDDLSQKYKFSKINSIVAISVLILFFIISSSLVKISRGSPESFTGTSKGLKGLKDNLIISPSLYLYLSSDIGVLSQYLRSDGDGTSFGQNTFLPVYDFLAKLGVVERPHDFQKGYYIPMWTNTGTYIRELHADFGVAGVFLGSYLIGGIITWLWFRFYEKKSLILFPFLVFMNLIIGFSFLVMVTRLLYWFISLFVIVLLIPALEKLAVISHEKSLENLNARI